MMPISSFLSYLSRSFSPISTYVSAEKHRIDLKRQLEQLLDEATIDTGMTKEDMIAHSQIEITANEYDTAPILQYWSNVISAKLEEIDAIIVGNVSKQEEPIAEDGILPEQVPLIVQGIHFKPVVPLAQPDQDHCAQTTVRLAFNLILGFLIPH